MQKHADRLGTKPFIIYNSHSREQEITDSLSRSKIRQTVSVGRVIGGLVIPCDIVSMLKLIPSLVFMVCKSAKL